MRFWLSILAVLVSLSACTTPDAFSERARLKPLREAALKGDDKALVQLRAEADRGNPEAQNQLAQYTLSSYDAQDEYLGKEGADYAGHLSRAIALLQKAADHGYAPAQYNLGYMYELRYHDLGLSEQESQRIAVDWYRKAARQGDGPSGYRIWYIWFRDTINAQVKPKDKITGRTLGPFPVPLPPTSAEEAMLWLKHAAERGHKESMYWLAGMSTDEKLLSRYPDYKEAYFWIRVFLKLHGEEKLASGVTEEPAKYAKHLSAEEIEQIDNKVQQWIPVKVPFPQAKN